MTAWTAMAVGGALAVVLALQNPRLQPLGTRAALVGGVRTASLQPQPIPDMEVRIRLSGGDEWKSATTDAAGNFTFRDLVPGRYSVELYGPGYREEYDDVVLRGGRETALTLHKRAVLEGRVIDDAGEPLAGIEVCALSIGRSEPRRTVPVEYAITNRDGVFRMSRHPLRSWLTLRGNYLLAVVPSGCLLAETGPPRSIRPLPGFVPTFFPAVTAVSEATVVAVAGDRVQSGFEIRLRRGATTRLEGRIAPLPQTLLPPVARVILEPPADQLQIARVLNVGPDGRFAFDAVVPGAYRLIVPPTWRVNARSLWAVLPIAVSGAPVQTVFVATQPSLEVTGRVLFDGQPTLLPGVRVFLTVNLEPVSDDRVDPSMLPRPFGPVDGSGRFVVSGVMPGRYKFTVSGADARGWTLDGATIPAAPGAARADRDVFDLPFAVSEGLDIPGAEISMTRAASTLRVLTRDDGDRPVPYLDVALFAADPRYWAPASRRIVRLRTTSAGRATFENLPKGDYVVAAVKALAPDWNTPRGLEALAAIGTRIRLGASDSQDVTIRTTGKSVQRNGLGFNPAGPATVQFVR
jgi:hypothetical protein